MSESTDTKATTAPTRYIPVGDWPNYHPWPSTGGMRHLIFHAKSNGFHVAVKRVGRRVLIDEAAFHRWVDEQNERGES